MSEDLLFAGQLHDVSSNLTYNYLRYYRRNLGRYNRRDDIGLFGSLSQYDYARNNPLRYLDRYALAAEVCEYLGREIHSSWTRIRTERDILWKKETPIPGPGKVTADDCVPIILPPITNPINSGPPCMPDFDWWVLVVWKERIQKFRDTRAWFRHVYRCEQCDGTTELFKGPFKTETLWSDKIYEDERIQWNIRRFGET